MSSLVEVEGAVGVVMGLRGGTVPTLSERTVCSVGKEVSMYCVCVCFCLFVFITPEGLTTMVAKEGLEKARACLNKVPRDRWLYIHSKGCGVNFR